MHTSKGVDGWVAYRPGVKVLDCTLRDGGLVNDHKFDDDFAKAVYDTAVRSGIDYVEFGYKASKKIFSRDEFGAWKFCDEDDLRRIAGDNPADIKISVMADAERCDYQEDILPGDQSVIDCIRVACYIHQIPTAMAMVQDAHDKGYETMLQLMAVSNVNQHDLLDALEIAAGSAVTAVHEWIGRQSDKIEWAIHDFLAQLEYACTRGVCMEDRSL